MTRTTITDVDVENVLLLTVDCLRADRFAEGIEDGTFEAMKRLAENGLGYANAFTVANTTDPSLTSMLTATHPGTHGVRENGWGLGEDLPVLAGELSAAGMETFGVVSVDHLSDDHSGLGRGFDAYHSGRGYDTLYPFLSAIYDTKTFNTVFGAVKNLGVGDYTVKSLLRDLGLIRLHCRTGASVTDDAVSEIRDRSGPFFGWVHYFDAHEPRNYAREHLEEHDEYTASLIGVDGYVSEVLAALEEAGVADETLVVLTGDHGEALGDHGYVGHGRTLYDEEIHVPLVFFHPDLDAGTVDDQVRTIDIAPTILDALGVEVPDSVEGRSLVRPADGDEAVPGDRDCYATAYPTFTEAVALRRPGWKLVRTDEGEQLYDLEDDPAETTDLVDADDPDVAAVRDELAAALDAHAGDDEGQGQTVDDDTREMLADLGYAE